MIGMRGIEELDHYEMLEIARGASPGEIDRAYRMAQQTYADGSLALYSIFEKRDVTEIRARLDEAYRVLADPELRASYDLDHRAPPPSTPESTASAADAKPAARSAPAPASRSASRPAEKPASPQRGGARRDAQVADPAPSSSRAFEDAPVPDFEDGARRYEARDDEAGGEFDGPRLRRTRLFRGYEIDQIADVTKVSGSHLRNIEDENFADLPAEVYVRGFVTAYAKTIGLDPQAVVPSYMARLQESRQKSQRSRFLGLR